MRFPRLTAFLFLVFSCLAGVCLAQNSAPAGAKSLTFLPQEFGGWQATGVVQTSGNPIDADRVEAPVLKEYGFKEFEGAIYARDDGRKLTVKAIQFEDASGAYGAFTFYKTPEMLNERIGDQAASLNQRILFYRGNILVDALFQRLSAMSAAELRELASDLPRPPGTGGNLPGLPAYLPKQDYVRNTAKYIVGPVALEKDQAPISAQYVDFSKGAEVVLGNYNLSGVPATLMLVSYPTPQIAATQLKQIQAAQQSPPLSNAQISVRRTGPILVAVSGAVSEGDAKSLLSRVNYDAEVTWNENTYATRRNNAANLIVGVILLAAIVCGLSIVVGVAFGGFRMAVKRFFPGKVFDRPGQMEIIALHLSDAAAPPPESPVKPSINAG